MAVDPFLDLFSGSTSKKAVVAAPGGNPPPPPAPPMDPAMMGGAMPPVPIEQEIASIKDMLQQLMDAQVAMMQMLAPGMAPGAGMPPAPPMDPAMMGGGMPADPAMMPPGMPPMDPSMMTAQASDEEQEKFASFIKSISDLLR